MINAVPIDCSTLESRLGYVFQNRQLLFEALTHPSYAYEQAEETKDNQRLEFLGDAVLQLIVTDHLFVALDGAPEGVMTKTRAGLVCERTLAHLAVSLGLGSFLRLGHGESMSGGASNPSNLADALEAILGAVYLEAGMEEARRVLTPLMAPFFELAIEGSLSFDYKSRLFEWAQARRGLEVRFEILSTSGPDHDRSYVTGLFIDGSLRAQGSGRTKKASEQDASRQFLETLPGE